MTRDPFLKGNLTGMIEHRNYRKDLILSSNKMERRKINLPENQGVKHIEIKSNCSNYKVII